MRVVDCGVNLKMAVAIAVMQNNNNVEKTKSYAKVSLSLENSILPTHKLYPTPSQLDGLDRETEIDLRILGCELIQTSGILLRLPQVAMATGQVLFQRFFYSKSFVRQSMEIVAMAGVTLASKIEEAPRRIRDVVNVFHHIKQVRAGKTIQPLILDQTYINLKNQVIKAERRVLKELGFCVHVKHPHKIIVTLLEVLKVKNKRLMQTAWNYMNDSLRCDVFVRYHPETIACGCIHLGAKLLQIPLPNNPAWYLIFNVTEEDINSVSCAILALYARKKPDPDRLEKVVEELKKTHQEAKAKAKEALNSNNQANSSPSQPSSPRNGTKSPGSDGRKDRDRNDKRSDVQVSPKFHKDVNHRKRRSLSPAEDGYQSTESKRRKSSSSGSPSSRSPSPKRKQKTPPRGFKDSHRSRSRSKSRGRSSTKKTKHRSTHKRKHSLSPSPPHHTSSKKSYKNKHSDKNHHAVSRSRSHERNHHSNSLHEKSSHKSRRDRTKENHHSRDKKRR